MSRPRRQHASLLALAAVLALVAAPSTRADRVAAVAAPGDVHLPRATVPLREYAPGALRAQARPAAVAAPLGTVRTWLALDETVDQFVPVPFRLAGAGEHVEVWVATSLTFPAGDCRNGVDSGARVAITPEQAGYLVETFDRIIHPRLASAFSVPQLRDGTRARANPSQYDSRGDGDDVVVLLDNIRDSNFYDRDNRGNEPYIAGFFSEDLIEFFDRNVLTVDAYDWLHRSGGTPPHHPVPGDLCASAPARPYQYEATLAHEFHHLLEHYEDPDEALWVDE